MLKNFFQHIIRNPWFVVLLLLAITVGLSSNLGNFRLDASSDSLVIEGDADLEYSRQVSQRYGTRDFVFIMVTPHDELFTEVALGRLSDMQAELSALPRVDSIDSILNVPLFKVANISLSELDADNLITLADDDVDLQQARDDLVSSQAYRDALISADGKSTTLAVYFTINNRLDELRDRRADLRAVQNSEQADQAVLDELRIVEQEYDSLKRESDSQRHEDISRIRQIISGYQNDAEIVMGGVPMIADDLITFVKSDLVTFGGVILVFIIASLSLLFRRIRYVFVPICTSVLVTVCVMGVLGLLNWPVTVISSNFISLLLIITISLNVHLIVRYRELQTEHPAQAHKDRLQETLVSMFQPCLYTSLTTIVAFGSLMISNIPPIIDFGWMMVIGVLFAFSMTFTFFPSVMSLMPEPAPLKTEQGTGGLFNFTALLARLTLNRRNVILGTAALLAVAVGIGITRLKVENSFINYFDKDTEIYRGMVSIDERMGGTTPLDVIVRLRLPGSQPEVAEVGEDDFWNDDYESVEASDADDAFWDDDDSEPFWAEDDAAFWDEEGSEETASVVSDDDAYWFTSDKMAEIVELHEFLDEIPETGKVLSLATLLKIAYGLNEDEPLNDVELAVLYNRIPDQYKESLLRPYVSVADDEVRFSIRVRESDPNLVRGELMDRIHDSLTEEFAYQDEQVRLSGMLVLYNNMLQSLFQSQILTLGVVLGVILLMFIILFRSISLALLGLIPNVLAAGLVLGIMGWADIPLDMMTITIAAISVGIGVDNTIHYIYRFKQGFIAENGDYDATVNYSHNSIGKAIYYTGFTIVAGFSILVLSNFIPTIYFGLLASVAMVGALLGSLSLLPSLLLLFRPLGIQDK